MAPPLAPACLRLSTQSCGSAEVNSDGQAAISRTITMSTSAAQKILLRRRSCQASAARLRDFPAPPGGAGWRTGDSAVRAFMSLIANPGVEYGVEQVDDQVQ